MVRNNRVCRKRFSTSNSGISVLADLIQVSALGVFTWFGFAILGIADVFFYMVAFMGILCGIASAFIQNGRCTVVNKLRVIAIILSIATAIIGLGTYGVEKVIEIWPLK